MNIKYSHLQKGDLLGDRYRIEALLGQGGMGSVYLAEDLRLKGKKWAVKELQHSLEDYASFVEEAEILVQLQHPHLPQLVDYYPPNDEGHSYLVMDYIQGPTLQELFEQKGKDLSYPVVLRYTLQLCELFQYLHTYKPRPIIYRDLKPSNVIIDENDQVRLIDFGIARHFKIGQDADTMQIGTIGFASPEQFTSLQTDHRSDLYTLGAMMYFLLAGGQYYYISQVRLEKLRPDLPEKLARIVHKLLLDQPMERYQTAQELKFELEALLAPKVGKDKRVDSLTSGVHYIPNKLVIIGSLYSGAGSTFAAISLARMLNELGVHHALIEHPANEPDLYMLLYGDRKAPDLYMFAADEVMENGFRGAIHKQVKEWRHGKTTWIPLNPERGADSWGITQTYKLLHKIQKPIIVWDVSTNWDDPAVIELCKNADEIIVVMDPSPGKINRPSSKKRIQQLLAQSFFGKKVEWIANRNHSYGFAKDWLQSLPQLPLCLLPNIAYDQVMRSVEKGECVQDTPEVKEKLLSSLQPLLSRIVPDVYFTKQTHNKEQGFLSKILRIR